jgi:hypothetical protein
MPDLPTVRGRGDLIPLGTALAVVIVVGGGYAMTWGQQPGTAVVERGAYVEGLAGPDGSAAVSAQERRVATERLRATCRDLEVRLAYNGPLEARPAPGPTPAGGLCARRTLTDADVLRLRYAPTPAPGAPQFADEQQLAQWKRDTLCRRPQFRAATSVSSAASTSGVPAPYEPLRGICTKPALGPEELRALRVIYVEDPVAAERTRLQRERERENLARPVPTP